MTEYKFGDMLRLNWPVTTMDGTIIWDHVLLYITSYTKEGYTVDRLLDGDAISLYSVLHDTLTRAATLLTPKPVAKEVVKEIIKEVPMPGGQYPTVGSDWYAKVGTVFGAYSLPKGAAVRIESLMITKECWLTVSHETEQVTYELKDFLSRFRLPSAAEPPEPPKPIRKLTGRKVGRFEDNKLIETYPSLRSACEDLKVSYPGAHRWLSGTAASKPDSLGDLDLRYIDGKE